MGHAASVDGPSRFSRETPGVASRSVKQKGTPMLMVPHPRRGTFFITFVPPRSSSSSFFCDASSVYSVWTVSKFQVRGGVEFKGHRGPVTGIGVLTAELHEFELFSRLSEDYTDPCLAMADPVTAGEELIITTSLDGVLRVFDVATQACVLEFNFHEPLIGLVLWPPTVIRQGLLKELGAIAGRGVACVATKSGNVIPLKFVFRNGVVTLTRIPVEGDIPPFDHFGYSLTSVHTSVAQSEASKDINFLVANPSGVSLYRAVLDKRNREPSMTDTDFLQPQHSLLENDARLVFMHVATRPLPQFRNGLSGAAFRTVNDSSKFAACGYDRVALFDSETFALLWSSLGHKSIITALTMSIDGRRIVTGDLEGVLHVWEAHSGRHLQELHGIHFTSVRNIHFLADDRFLMSTAADAKEVVRTVPRSDARHLLIDAVHPRVLPKEIGSWFVSAYLAPSDVS